MLRSSLRVAFCCVGCICQPVQRREELLRLTIEEVHVGEEGRGCCVRLPNLSVNGRMMAQ